MNTISCPKYVSRLNLKKRKNDYKNICESKIENGKYLNKFYKWEIIHVYYMRVATKH